MKTIACTTLGFLFLCSCLVSAVQLGSLSLGFHFIPSVETVDGKRLVDMTLSLGASLNLDSENSIDLLVLIDSRPSSLGTSAQFTHRVTDPLKAGLGVTILWPFSLEKKLEWPILGTYAHACARTYLYPEFWVETGISFSLLTLANQQGHWSLLPLSELPTLTLAADVRVVDQGAVQARFTVQPVIVDTTALVDPIWRISDDLLILPMGSVFLEYTL